MSTRFPAGACTRRRLLNRGTAIAGSLAGLSSCRSRDDRDLVYAIGWVPNVEYADLWVAMDRGYFAQEHIALKIWPGGPNAPQPLIQVAARQAHVGEAEWLPLLDAFVRGNEFVIIASIFPLPPAGLMSLPRRPVRRPADLPHCRFLVQGPNERTAVRAIFKLNRLPTDYQLVPAGFSPEALLNGAGDAYYCFVTNQPLVFEGMGMRPGADFFVTRLDELGYKVPSTLIFVERKVLEKRRTQLVGFLRARLRGKAVNDRDPLYAAKLAVNKFGVDLGLILSHELLTNERQLPLYQAPGSRCPFWISESDLRDHMYPAAVASGRTTLPDPSQIMDMSLLEEAYYSLNVERSIQSRKS